MSEALFRQRFEERAAPVRRWLTFRSALSALGFGFAGGALLSAVAWATRQDLRPHLIAAGVLGSLAWAIGSSMRSGLTPPELALFMDHRLKGQESITTAVEGTGGEDVDGAALESVFRRATTLLAEASPTALRPKLSSRGLWALPVGLALAALALRLPDRAPEVGATVSAGVETVRLDATPELDRVISELEMLAAKPGPDRERLSELKAKAEALREKVTQGAPRRAVQTDLADLTDGLAEARPSLGQGDERAGFEAALGALAEPELEGAKRALGDKDLPAFDRALSELAKGPQAARDKAQGALREARDRAAAEGAEETAAFLNERLAALTEHAEKGAAAKELARAMAEAAPSSPDVPSAGLKEGLDKAAEALENGTAEEAAQALDTMKEALSKLSKEERDAVAKALKKRAEQSPQAGGPEAERDLKALAEKLKSQAGDEDVKAMLDALKDGTPSSPSTEKLQKIQELEDELGKLKSEIAGGSSAPDGASTSDPNAGPKGSPSGGPKAGSGEGPKGAQPGGEPGGGPKGSQTGGEPGGAPKGSQAGQTKSPDGSGGPGGTGGPPTSKKPGDTTAPTDAKEVALRARAALGGGPSLPGRSGASASRRAAGPAGRAGTGALSEVAAEEILGASRSDIPAEYRDQVGKYFRP